MFDEDYYDDYPEFYEEQDPYELEDELRDQEEF